jgi:hypothetical protein
MTDSGIEFNEIRYRIEDGIAHITLNRPDARTAPQVLNPPSGNPYADCRPGELRPGMWCTGLRPADSPSAEAAAHS